MSRVIAVVAGLAAALAYAISAVVEQRGTKRVKGRRALSPKLLFDLLRQPLWVAGTVANVIGFLLVVVALRFGPLALVEPLGPCDLIFASLINGYLKKLWDPLIVAGMVACTAGVVGFLAIARPSGGRSEVSLSAALPLLAGLAVLLAACLAVVRWDRRVRPLALALACGIAYGVTDFCLKLVTSEFGHGLSYLFVHWPIYAVAIVGPVGFVLNQNAFQQGTLLSPVLAIITICDPLVAITLASVLLDEHLASTPAGKAGEFVSLLVMIAGTVVLARHGPQVERRLDDTAARSAGAKQTGGPETQSPS